MQPNRQFKIIQPASPTEETLPDKAKNGIFCYKYLFTGGDRKGCVTRSIVLTLEKDIEEG
jgi:hypothetical protein